MTRKEWTAAEDRLLRRHFPHERSAAVAERLGRSVNAVSMRAHAMGLRKSVAFLSGAMSGRLRAGGNQASISTRFKPGDTPWNKGVPGATGLHPNCVRTHFKAGVRQGRAAQLHQPVGATRLVDGGYLSIKISDEGPFHRRWRYAHLIAWERVNGPLPAGHAVVFRNGDKTDIRLDNLELITRAQLMRRNSHHGRVPPEVSRLIQLRGALNRQINRKERQREQHDR